MAPCICENCKISFHVTQSDKNRGRGRFCGKSCASSGVNNSAYKHGNSERTGQTKEYQTWAGMIKRVNDTNFKYYHRYGGRGITMCGGWRHNFSKFLEDIGKSPAKSYSIERIDNDGNYSCGTCDECISNGWISNCKWATEKEQASNKSDNKILTYNGESLTQEEWGRRVGLSGTIICKRLGRGWSLEKALTTPHMRPHFIKMQP